MVIQADVVQDIPLTIRQLVNTRHALDNAGTHLGMILIALAFLDRQRPPLQKQAVGDGDLADIMQRRTNADQRQIILHIGVIVVHGAILQTQ